MERLRPSTRQRSAAPCAGFGGTRFCDAGAQPMLHKHQQRAVETLVAYRSAGPHSEDIAWQEPIRHDDYAGARLKEPHEEEGIAEAAERHGKVGIGMVLSTMPSDGNPHARSHSPQNPSSAMAEEARFCSATIWLITQFLTKRPGVDEDA